MKTVRVNLNQLYTSALDLGFVGENEHRQIVIDCAEVFAEYPHAVPALTVQPPMGMAYPATAGRDGDNVVWTITDSDLIKSGRGEMQLTFTENGVVVKSCIGRISINRSIEPSGDVPEPIENWLVEANTALNAIPQTIDDALEEAKESGEFDGFSPTATVNKSGDTATISITDKEGTTTTTVKDGDKGDPGEDGFSPSASVTKVGKKATVTITDKNGTTTAEINDGEDGTDGQDGFSPTATVTKSGRKATISITDKNGTTTAEIDDGQDGQDGHDGADGFSPTASVSKSGGKATITITDKNGTTTAEVDDGQDGATGATPVISIGTVETLTPGSPATASMDTTDPEHPVLSMGIPEGEPGDATIDDTSTAADRVWSAKKTSELKSALESSKADVIIDTASGAIASFPDGADNLPMALTVGIEPVQDLHGQSNPYPPGGGKNLVDYNLKSYFDSPTFSFNQGTYTVSTKTGYTGDAWYISAKKSDNSWCTIEELSLTGFYQASTPGLYYGEASKTYFTFTVPENNVAIRIGRLNADGTNPVQIEVGSSATAWTPYSNICPISGWTGANVSRTGVNLYNTKIGDDNWSNINNATHSDSNGELIVNMAAQMYSGCYSRTGENALAKLAGNPKIAGAITYSCYIKTSIATYLYVGYQAFGNRKITTTTDWQRFTWSTTFTGTTNSFNIYNGTANAVTTYLKDMQVEFGSVESAYEAPSAVTYPITFPNPPGTVYGGTLTVNTDGTGKLVVDMASVDMGSMSWIYNAGVTWFYTEDVKNEIAEGSGQVVSNILTPLYKTVSRATAPNLDYCICVDSSENVIVKDSRYTDKTVFKTAMSGQTLVYELKTPVVYNLTNLEVIKTLKGLNNVWADTGNVSLEYPADTKLYISKELSASQKLLELIVTANREDSMKATKAYSTGNLLIVNGTLYKATTSIANGATLTVGTNVTATTVANELALLA